MVTLRPGRSRAQARALIDAELAAVADAGVDADELHRVQNGRLAGFLYALENIGGFGGVADRLNAYNIYLGDPGRITSDVARYQAVTRDDLGPLAGRYLVGKPRVALEVVGNRGPALVSTSTAASTPPLDRSVPPVSPPA